MQTSNVHLSKKRIGFIQLLKWLSIPLVILALYYQLFVQFDFQSTKDIFLQDFSVNRLIFALLALALMPINLGIEALKWQKVLKYSHQLTYSKAWQSIFAGISLSIFTPKRVGEYAGRLLILPKDHLKAIPSLLVSNLSQSIANISLGLMSLVLFALNFSIHIEQFQWGILASVVLFVLLTVAYFNVRYVISLLKKWKWTKKWSHHIESIASFRFMDLSQVLTLSFLKYLVFIIQFVLLIAAFGVDLPWYWGLIAASCVFFVKTILPVPASVELAMRGSIALFFFSLLTTNQIGILVASIGLWIINLGVPALLGSLYISKN